MAVFLLSLLNLSKLETAPKYSFDDLKSFITDKICCHDYEVIPDCDIVYDLGCYGDDFHEFITQYATRFKVDVNSCLWYFHTKDEGASFSIGASIFKPPYERVKHIPVTPSMLLSFANAGKWSLAYPEHSLPKRRYDIWINRVVVLLVISFVIYKCTR